MANTEAAGDVATPNTAEGVNGLSTPTPRHRKESYPAKAAAQRRRWEDPAYRERVTAAMTEVRSTPECKARYSAGRLRSAEDRRKDPVRYSRLGIPTGYTRATASEAWALAEAKADAAIRALEAAGVVPPGALVPLLGSNSGEPALDDEELDAALAKLALHGAVKLALGPGDKRTKMQALKLVLDYTMPRPSSAVRRTIVAEGPEGWLQSVLRGVAP